MPIGTILIRADATVAMGTGHLMRCLALAQHWQDSGGQAVFVVVESTDAVSSRLMAEGFEVVRVDAVAGSLDDAAKVTELARARSASWVVVDGYQFNSRYQREIKRAGLRLLWMDDNAEATPYFADIVANQNIHGNDDLYREREAYTRLLLGPRFALLRREFTAHKTWRREIRATGLKVLVTMGGSDPLNLSTRVVEALDQVSAHLAEIVVLVGGSNPHLASLKDVVARRKSAVRLETDVYDVAEWMMWADMAIAAAGSTCWEMCMMGLPSVVMEVAPNQAPLAFEMDRVGAAVRVDPAAENFSQRITKALRPLIESSSRRSEMSAAGRECVDGNGSARVIAAMRGRSITLRRAASEDCRMVWEWANDPVVRQASFRSAHIPWDQHVLWFDKKLRDDESVFFIASDESGEPAGQVRFDRAQPNEFEIGIIVAPGKRGTGLGVCLMIKAMDQMLRDRIVTKLHAFIKPENTASIRLFREAGFHKLGTSEAAKPGALHFVYDPAIR